MRWILIAAVVGLLALGGVAGVGGGDEPCVAVEEGGHIYLSPPDCVPPENNGANGSGGP
ncbi:MAG TPA: hypothetical protein VGR28_14070 [Candidatus Thermoplasmatota archaeon]|jgi:hypothetical protein|nr:hypothetical protein [Candidatus Thermoplasmatota archaeon]